MPRPYNQKFTPSAANASFFVTGATGSSITLTATAIGDSGTNGISGIGHQITVTNTNATSLTGINFTITGIDQDGASQSETFVGPGSSATITSTYYYRSLSAVTTSATMGSATVNIGFNSAIATQTFPISWDRGLPIMTVIINGTANCTVEYTNDLIQTTATRPYNWLSNAGSPLSGATTSSSDTFTGVPLAVRLTTASYSSGAVLTFEVSQKQF
jgi:hypothetical protein